ncbi:MAG: hypothetical protein CSA81_10120 [Acidobacteria bacterium]|nr:MAG: hypothetical protein CSA81_10120 [Acidobacteriota bacterium]
MKKTISIMFVLLSAMSFAGNAEFIRYAVPSPDGSKICFSYQGDIWVVAAEGGSASRITVHPGYDYNPQWSPKGDRIAFVSDRTSSDQIYSMKTDGSDVKRHTFYPGGNRLFSWSKNGDALIFGSKRNDRYAWMPEVYKVSLEGETPQKLFNFNAIDGACAPDQHTFYFVNGYDHRWRKNYRGATNNDIFSYSPKEKKMVQHTVFDGNDLHPMPVKDGLYFVSDRSGRFNIHYLDFKTKKISQLTDVKRDGIRHAAISNDGSTIVYSNFLDTYILTTADGKSTKCSIQVPEDSPFTELEFKNFSSKLSNMVIAPKEKEAVIDYHGELYAVKLNDKEPEKAVRMTESAFHDKDPIWSKDGKKIYFLSDREGQFDLYQIEPTEDLPFYLNTYFKLTRLTETAEDESALDITPDGKSLSYGRGNGNLIVRDIDSGEERVLLKGWNLGPYQWSPDSKWLAFARDDDNFNTDVFIIAKTGGQAVNISQHPDIDTAPVWSPDGKMLAFSSRRFGTSMEVLYTYLTEEDSNKTLDDWKREKELEALKKEKAKKKEDKSDKSKKKDKKKGKEEPKKKDESSVSVAIDFKDIHKRVVRLTRHLGDAYPVAITCKDRSILYVLMEEASSDLYLRDLNKKNPAALTTNNAKPRAVQLFKDRVYYLSKGSVKSVNLKGKDKKSYKLKGVFSQKKSEETMQVFQEIWRVQNDYFYDANFHGADWAQLRKDYTVLMSAIRHERDFADLMNMMVGELNASHQRYSGPRGKRVAYGNLGAQFKVTEKGLEITDIMPKGPLTKAKPKVQVGDIVTEVNRRPFTNIHELLRDQQGKLVELTILRGDKTFHADTRPDAHRHVTGTLAYDAWIEKNREKVHNATDDKLGYVHIKGMSIPSLEVFETELFSEAEGKDALIIDVRYNGGGWITDFLLNILTTAEHAYTIPRNGGKGYPQGRRTFYHWTKPIYVLCNEFSYSNAEIFSHAIKTLKRGTLIGKPTFGAVISTGGKGLLNGGFIRMPFRGWYVKGSDLNQENNGAVPDYIVDYTPLDQLEGRDPQLDKAIQLFVDGQ